MGLISPGGENLQDFLELGQVLSTYDGDLRDPLWGPQERPFPIRVARGLSRFLFRRCWGLRTCVESVPEPEVSSPVLTWISGFLWSLGYRYHGESVNNSQKTQKVLDIFILNVCVPVSRHQSLLTRLLCDLSYNDLPRKK